MKVIRTAVTTVVLETTATISAAGTVLPVAKDHSPTETVLVVSQDLEVQTVMVRRDRAVNLVLVQTDLDLSRVVLVELEDRRAQGLGSRRRPLL